MAKKANKYRLLADNRTMWAAWARVASGSRAPGVDGMTSDRYAAHLDRHLSELQAHLANGTYCPQPLKPMTVTRHGKQRHLGLSTVRDRIAQRCFLEVYARELDAANAESSFAYRKGRSWLDALARVERYRDAGLRTVFRGDIAEFFDRIDHEVLRQALTDLLSDDRAVALAMSWMTAPVLGRNGMEPRTRGVPLGAPVSPALANLYLTGFDREINSRRSGGVRYADDLVVCCVDAASAEAARFDVEQSLRPLHLEIGRAHV